MANIEKTHGAGENFIPDGLWNQMTPFAKLFWLSYRILNATQISKDGPLLLTSGQDVRPATPAESGGTSIDLQKGVDYEEK